MSNFQPINPKPFLKSLIGKQIIVRLKWNKLQYKGILVSIDNYMNLQLDQTYEINSQNKEKGEEEEELIGEIFIRCNNVLFIRQAKEEEEENSNNDHQLKKEEQQQQQEEEKDKVDEVIEKTKEEITEVVMDEN